MIYIFDIDGTLANAEHRLEHIQKLPKDWDAFFEACRNDEEIPWVSSVCKSLYDSGFTIIMLTGRPERTREKTLQWLHDHHIPFHQVLMRPEKNFRPDHELKPKMLEEANFVEPILGIFEDRRTVVDAWRAMGYNVFHVDVGEF